MEGAIPKRGLPGLTNMVRPFSPETEAAAMGLNGKSADEIIQNLRVENLRLKKELEKEQHKNKNAKLEHSRHMEKISAELQRLSIKAQKGKDWEKQNTQRTKKPKLVSAGPHATRIKEHEYEAGETDDGETFCKKCLQKGHRTNTCVYVSACIYCGGREVLHSSNYHDQAQKAYWKKKAAEQEEPRISMNNLE